ncbi:MAG: nitrous oxide reductase family maturation protein NosD [Promethearchaeota archaeon]
MYIKRNTKISILVILCIIFSSSLFFSPVFRNVKNQENKSQETKNLEFNQPKTSGSWILNYIYVNGNWSATNTTYDWCNGKGTIDDPYVIENVTIYGGRPPGCILIENCSDYFLIRNCTLKQAYIYNNPGIHLNNSINGIITNNTIDTSTFGIYLYNSSSTQIFDNRIYSNKYGVYLNNSNNNNITQNYIGHNNNTAITLAYSFNNTIHKNKLNDNPTTIRLFYSNKTTISENVIFNYRKYGISLEFSNNNSISKNYINNLFNVQVYLGNTSVSIYKSLNNTVENNRLLYVWRGLYLGWSNYTIYRHNIIYYYLSCSKIEFCNDSTNVFFNNTCINLNPLPPISDDDDKEDEEQENIILLLIIFFSLGSVAILSGLSVYYFKKIKLEKLKKFEFGKKLRSSSRKEKFFEKILNKEKILRAFDKENFLNTESPLNLLDLTFVSEKFLEIVDKFGLDEADKSEFIKEMLSYSLEERNEFIKNMLKDLNLD